MLNDENDCLGIIFKHGYLIIEMQIFATWVYCKFS